MKNRTFEDKYGRDVRVGNRVQTYTDLYGHDKIEGQVIKIEQRGEEEGPPFIDIHVLIDKVYSRDGFPGPWSVGQTWISGDNSDWYLRLDED